MVQLHHNYKNDIIEIRNDINRMRKYDYKNKWKELLTPDIVMMLTKIHECKGQQNLFIEQKAETLTHLLETAKIQSTEASNKIEGIFTSDERLNLLVKEKTTPKNRNEEEIAGYRNVLATIHENHDYIPIQPTYLLQLHRDLYKFSGLSIGGSYKNANNVITETSSDGTKRLRFKPVDSWETPDAVESMCQAFDEVMNENNSDALIIIPMFILDFLSIHPFNDGNGRMSRLLTLLLLYRAGYIVGKYISIESIIEKSKETYYEVLEKSSEDWYEETNDYEPFVRYMLGVIVSAYRDFQQKVDVLWIKGITKPKRVEQVIKDTLGKITKQEIANKCPDISMITIQRTLVELTSRNEIIKIGGGRYTSYTWNRENNK